MMRLSDTFCKTPRFGFVCAALFAALLTVIVAPGQVRSDQELPQRNDAIEVLRIRRLELVDEAGEVRALLATGPNGSAGLYVPNEDKPVAFFGLRPSGSPMIGVSGREGQFGFLWINPEIGGPTLTLCEDAAETIVTANPKAFGITATMKTTGESASMLVLPGNGAGVSLTNQLGYRKTLSTDGP